MSKKKNNERLADLESWSQDMMERHGWYIHFVPNDEDFPNGINYHTHGIIESFNNPDFQICFPIQQEVAHQIIHNVVDRIKAGEIFVPGKKYKEIIGNDLSIEFIPALECGRQVLRMIFPNKDGSYQGDVFSSQFEMTGI